MTFKKLSVLVSTATIVLGVSSAAAQSLADREFSEKLFADEKTEMAAIVDPVNKDCGSNVSYEFKKESFTRDYAGYSATGTCANAFEALRELCKTNAGKDAVSKKITKVVCSMQKGIRGTVSLEGTTVNYVLGTEGGGMGATEIKEQLAEKL